MTGSEDVSHFHMFFLYFSAIKTAFLDPSGVNAMNPGFRSGGCPLSSKGYTYGWHFVLPDLSHSFINISCTFSKAGTVTDMIREPCAMHAYVYTPTADTLLGASANVSGTSNTFILSDVCSPPSKCERKEPLFFRICYHAHVTLVFRWA